MKTSIYLKTGLLTGCLLMGNAWTASAEVLCDEGPQLACVNDQKMAWVKLKANGNWMAKWHKGTVESFGDPTASDDLTPSTSYAVCIYADDVLILGDRAAAGSEWTTAGEYKVKYNSEEGNIRKLRIKVPSNDKGNSGKGKIKAKGVLPEDFVLPLNVQNSLAVQYLQIEDDVVTSCWESVFGTDGIKHDSEIKFQARAKKAKPAKPAKD